MVKPLKMNMPAPIVTILNPKKEAKPMQCRCGTGTACVLHMKGSHNFRRKDGTIVDRLPPEEEKKFLDNLRQSFADTVWQMMQQRRHVKVG